MRRGEPGRCVSAVVTGRCRPVRSPQFFGRGAWAGARRRPAWRPRLTTHLQEPWVAFVTSDVRAHPPDGMASNAWACWTASASSRAGPHAVTRERPHRCPGTCAGTALTPISSAVPPLRLRDDPDGARRAGLTCTEDALALAALLDLLAVELPHLDAAMRRHDRRVVRPPAGLTFTLVAVSGEAKAAVPRRPGDRGQRGHHLAGHDAVLAREVVDDREGSRDPLG